jgi:hypothetical protein
VTRPGDLRRRSDPGQRRTTIRGSIHSREAGRRPDRGQAGERSEEAEAGVDLGGGGLGGRSHNERDEAWRQAQASNGDVARTGTDEGRGELAAAVDGSGHKTSGYGSPNLGSDTMLGTD